MARPRGPLIHGKPSTYVYHRCRCLVCRDAWTAYWQANRKKHKREGRCISCRRPLCSRSIRFCLEHLEKRNSYDLKYAKIKQNRPIF